MYLQSANLSVLLNLLLVAAGATGSFLGIEDSNFKVLDHMEQAFLKNN